MRVTEKGQVTIPKEIRDRLKIGPGAEVGFVPDDKGVRLVVLSTGKAEEPRDFEAWLNSRSGLFDTYGMSGKEYVDWLRGPREDLGSD